MPPEYRRSVVLGEDSNGDTQFVQVTTGGKIEVNDVSLASNPNTNIGDVNLLDSTDTVVNPATEPTLSSVDSQLVDLSTTALDVSAAPVTIEGRNAGTDVPVIVDSSGNMGIAVTDSAGNLHPLKGTTDGVVETEDVRAYPEFNASDGYLAPSTSTWDTLNGGTTQTIPRGVTISVTAHSGNSSDVWIRTKTGNRYPLSAGEEQQLGVQDVTDIEAQAQTSGDQIKWVVESEN